MDDLNVAGRKIGPAHPPYVVAEIGANHNGDMNLCRQTIGAAKEAGADAVKFQSWSKDSLIGRAEFDRNTKYAKQNPSALTLEQAVERYQLTPEQHREVAAYCRDHGVTFFSSCFSAQEVDLLESLNVPVYKGETGRRSRSRAYRGSTTCSDERRQRRGARGRASL